MLILKFFSAPLAGICPKDWCAFQNAESAETSHGFSETQYFKILHFSFFLNKNDDFRFQEMPRILENKDSKTLR